MHVTSQCAMREAFNHVLALLVAVLLRGIDRGAGAVRRLSTRAMVPTGTIAMLTLAVAGHVPL
jgi:hypothetical protein